MSLLVGMVVLGLFISCLISGIRTTIQNAQMNRPTDLPRETPLVALFALVALCLILPLIDLAVDLSIGLYLLLAFACFDAGLALGWIMGPELLDVLLGQRLESRHRRRPSSYREPPEQIADEPAENPFANFRDNPPTAGPGGPPTS
jgi:hypothetical protein